MLTACMLGARFSIVAGGVRWVPMLTEPAAIYGLERRLASVRAHSLTGSEIACDRAAAVPVLAALAGACIEEDGAECIILGGAGPAPELAPRLPVPILDVSIAPYAKPSCSPGSVPTRQQAAVTQIRKAARRRGCPIPSPRCWGEAQPRASGLATTMANRSASAASVAP
jgi:hypothetical protein